MDIHLEKRRKGEGNGAANTKRKFVEPETTETHPLIYSPVKAVKQVKDLGFGVVQAFKKRKSREFDTLETHPAIHSSPKTTPPGKRQVEALGPEVQTVKKRKFVGVRQRPSRKWVAEIKNTTQKIRMWLGTFDTAEEAAHAYDEAACLLRGSNTKTNFLNHFPPNLALSLKIRNLLTQKQQNLNKTKTPKPPTNPQTFPSQILGDNNAYKPNFILGELGYDHHPQTPFLTDFDTFLVTQHQSSSSTYETRSLQIPELEQMKVERQICGGSVYATINGVNEYWENYSLSDAFLDLPMICQMFCPT